MHARTHMHTHMHTHDIICMYHHFGWADKMEKQGYKSDIVVTGLQL